MIWLSVNVTPQMSVCQPSSHHTSLEGISNSNLTPCASLLLGVGLMTPQRLAGASGTEGGRVGTGDIWLSGKMDPGGEYPILAWGAGMEAGRTWAHPALPCAAV